MIQPWNVVIASDDETLRQDLRAAIQVHPDFRLVGEAADGSATVSLLDQLRPDLAFIGVQFPDLDACEVLGALRPRDWPMVVFIAPSGVGSNGSLATSGVDCLTGTPDQDSIRRTLDRASERLDRAPAAPRERLEGLLSQMRPQSLLRRLPLRRNGRIEVLELTEVDWISAAGNYVELHTHGRRLLYRTTLKTLAERVDPRRFARIHRSTIVNVERVLELEPTPQGDWKLALDTGDRLRLSRRYREALDRLQPPPRHQSNGYRHA